ncbi:2EXR domain-containing protein [Aspergillus melleus]|uniref:2EXR domain-containing protein n=1 Tax=Aspergillus melleus TaxID=138277 RepID=UPI001E8CD41E|nr:uncharacterized protein LDX57_009475 [Aspergillus melleus]KAH8431824.1 hypothetical protein LDX57_009475 [Aspergillus melleus]
MPNNPFSSSSLCSNSGPGPYNTFPLFPSLPAEIRLQIWSLSLCCPSVFQPRTVNIACHRAVHPIHRRRYAKTFSTSTPPPSLLLVNHEARTEALRVYRPHFHRIPVVQVDDVQMPVDRSGSTSRTSSNSRSSSGSQIEGNSADEAHEQQHGDGNTESSLSDEITSAKGQKDSSVPAPVQEQKPIPKPTFKLQSIYIAFDRETLRLREDVLSYIPELELGLIERMVVDVADAHYFGHFYLEIIRSMGRLRTLELVVGVTHSDRVSAGRGAGAEDGNGNGNGEIGGIEGWAEGGMMRLERDVELLMDEFREMRESDPEWDCPEVRIVLRDSGVVVGSIEGGRGSSMHEGVDISA